MAFSHSSTVPSPTPKELPREAGFMSGHPLPDIKANLLKRMREVPVSLILYDFSDQPKLMRRPYRSRTYIPSFVAMYTIRYTNGPVPTERIELPASTL